MYSSLYQQLQHNPGHWVFTANERLARYLRQGFEQEMQRQGRVFWETPFILSLNGGLTQLYQNGLDAGIFTDTLLTPLQTQMPSYDCLSDFLPARDTARVWACLSVKWLCRIWEEI